MILTRSENRSLQLLMIQDGKYFVKISGLDIPITMNEYLYKKWSHQISDDEPATEENAYHS